MTTHDDIQAAASELEAAKAIAALVEAKKKDHNASPDAFVPNTPTAAKEYWEAVNGLQWFEQGAASVELGPQKECDINAIGHYRILKRLGEGGFGVVYLAEQTKPLRRLVAIKLIKLGMETKSIIARFEAERQALAMMEHPNIAKVFDAGTSEDGRPYFVMEFVAGLPIDEYCDQNRLGLTARLDLFTLVCQAVQHAHQKSIIHRDLKRSNILVIHRNGTFVPKVIDFGVAKALGHRLSEHTIVTERGQMFGTPAYMSPEQANSARDIDTRSDIYSLGVLLYELLTGTLPFDADLIRKASADEVRRLICTVDPPKPSKRLEQSLSTAGNRTNNSTRTDERRLRRQLQGDLDWIVMKCLEKDRTRRYQTASDLVSDILRYANNEPVMAGPPSNAYRLRKFVRRNKTGVIAASLLVATLLLGLVGTSFGLYQAKQRRVEAVDALERMSEAKAEAEARTKELELVTEFHASTVDLINSKQMGITLIDDLRRRVRISLKADNLSSPELERTLGEFDQMLLRVNATDVAINLIDSELLRRAAVSVYREFADQPTVRAAILQAVADSYARLGLLALALPLQKSAFETRRDTLGDDHLDTLYSMRRTGVVLRVLGKYEEAEQICRDALEKSRRLIGNKHPETLSAINQMGILADEMGKYDRAALLFRELLEGRQRILGDDHPATLTSINNLAESLKMLGNYDEAVLYYRKAIEHRRRVLGGEHPETLISMSNLGFMCVTLGKYQDAEQLFRMTLNARRRVLGSDHPSTLISIFAMGYVYESMDRLEDAEVCHREALERRRNALGKNHADTLTSMNSLGGVLNRAGKHEEALVYIREALDNKIRLLGKEHLNTILSMVSMGQTLRSMGRLDDAERYFREGLEQCRRMFDENHPRMAPIMSQLGEVLREQGRFEEAESYGAEAVRRGRNVPPTGHRHLARYLLGHGRTLAAMNRFAEAECEIAEAYDLLVAQWGSNHKRTIECKEHLAALCEMWLDADPINGCDMTLAD